jgi:hypothetical protein
MGNTPPPEALDLELKEGTDGMHDWNNSSELSTELSRTLSLKSFKESGLKNFHDVAKEMERASYSAEVLHPVDDDFIIVPKRSWLDDKPNLEDPTQKSLLSIFLEIQGFYLIGKVGKVYEDDYFVETLKTVDGKRKTYKSPDEKNVFSVIKGNDMSEFKKSELCQKSPFEDFSKADYISCLVSDVDELYINTGKGSNLSVFNSGTECNLYLELYPPKELTLTGKVTVNFDAFRTEEDLVSIVKSNDLGNEFIKYFQGRSSSYSFTDQDSLDHTFEKFKEDGVPLKILRCEEIINSIALSKVLEDQGISEAIDRLIFLNSEYKLRVEEVLKEIKTISDGAQKFNNLESQMRPSLDESQILSSFEKSLSLLS